MVHEHSPIRTEVSAFHKSLCSGKHHQEWWWCQWQGLHWPHQEWLCFWYHGLQWALCQMGRTLRESAVTFSARVMTMNLPKCMAILLTKGPWFGFGLHRCLHIQGCSVTCGTITETPSICILLFDRTAEHITLTLGQTNTFKLHLTRRDFPYSILLNTLI